MLKRCVILIAFFVGVILCYLASAFILSRIAVNRNVVPGNEVEIFILTNGVHTDLVLPIRTSVIDWSKTVKFTNTTKKDSTAKWVAFGWGDRGFYLETPTWGDLKFSTAFKAAFALGSSAIHTTFYRQLREDDNCKKIKIGTSDYEKLVLYISSSFRHANGDILNISTHANYGDDDAFYEAVGSYSLFHTCNTWANNGLKACGQRACLWTPFDSGIFYQYSGE